MSSFTTPLIVSPMPDGRTWKLCQSFTYHIGSEFSRHMIKVPKGFITDFASTPQFLWFWLPFWGKYGKAAVLHDYLYHSHSHTRLQSDRIFLEAMLCCGTPAWKARMMFYGVRCFGWLAWGLQGKKKAKHD